MLDEILLHHKQNTLHHAYLIVAEPSLVRVELHAILSEILGGPAQGHADFWSHTSELFGIKESRLLREAQSMKAFGPRRCFLIETQGMTDEAENALLKTLEEPTPGNRFFIVTPRKEGIRDTLLSRMVSIDTMGEVASKHDPEKFLASTPQERLRYIERFLPKKTATPDEKKVLKRELALFVHDIEKAIHEKDLPSLAMKETYESLAKLAGYLQDQGAATRLLAEHLALVLPML